VQGEDPRGDTVAAIPLAVELRPFIRKHFRETFHGSRDQTIRLRHRLARFIHKAALIESKRDRNSFASSEEKRGALRVAKGGWLCIREHIGAL
jgi:hypothetical protein